MVIKNETKQTTLSDSAIFAKSLRQKAFGLILYKKPATMIFQTRFGIHTFFMRYPIDVIVLSEENTVAAMIKSLKPNKLFVWNPKYHTLVELPEGTIDKTHTEKFDKILLLSR